MRTLVSIPLIVTILFSCYQNHKAEKQNTNAIHTNIDTSTVTAIDTLVLNETFSDSILVGGNKYLILSRIYDIEKTIIEHNDLKYFDTYLEISCYKNSDFVFKKGIAKKDFSIFFVDNDINNYLITGCSLHDLKINPFVASVFISICAPESDDCLNFILQFDENGNFTINLYSDNE